MVAANSVPVEKSTHGVAIAIVLNRIQQYIDKEYIDKEYIDQDKYNKHDVSLL